MSGETIRSPEVSRDFEVTKSNFRHVAMKLFSILKNSKGEPAANNTDAMVVDFARALQHDEETENKIAAIYDSVSGGEEGAPEGALDAVDELVAISKKYRGISGE